MGIRICLEHSQQLVSSVPALHYFFATVLAL